MSKKYAIGVDFGSLLGRVVLVDVTSGEEFAVAILNYPRTDCFYRGNSYYG